MSAIGLDHNGISWSKFFNYSSTLPAAARATNSDSIVEPVMQVCFLEAGMKWISDKRTKNEAKTDKIEHGMEKREKTKSNRSQSQQKSKSTP
ncbi:hypothetical protein Tco_1443476 [Tanacetum coccineum]